MDSGLRANLEDLRTQYTRKLKHVREASGAPILNCPKMGIHRRLEETKADGIGTSKLEEQGCHCTDDHRISVVRGSPLPRGILSVDSLRPQPVQNLNRTEH